MTRKQFRQLNNDGVLSIPRTIIPNTINSATDPTLNVSVGAVYDALVTGQPLDIPQNRMEYNQLHSDQMSSIEKRNNDQFDCFAEQRNLQKNISQKVGKIAEIENYKKSQSKSDET